MLRDDVHEPLRVGAGYRAVAQHRERFGRIDVAPALVGGLAFGNIHPVRRDAEKPSRGRRVRAIDGRLVHLGADREIVLPVGEPQIYPAVGVGVYVRTENVSGNVFDADGLVRHTRIDRHAPDALRPVRRRGRDVFRRGRPVRRPDGRALDRERIDGRNVGRGARADAYVVLFAVAVRAARAAGRDDGSSRDVDRRALVAAISGSDAGGVAVAGRNDAPAGYRNLARLRVCVGRVRGAQCRAADAGAPRAARRDDLAAADRNRVPECRKAAADTGRRVAAVRNDLAAGYFDDAARMLVAAADARAVAAALRRHLAAAYAYRPLAQRLGVACAVSEIGKISAAHACGLGAAGRRDPAAEDLDRAVALPLAPADAGGPGAARRAEHPRDNGVVVVRGGDFFTVDSVCNDRPVVELFGVVQDVRIYADVVEVREGYGVLDVRYGKRRAVRNRNARIPVAAARERVLPGYRDGRRGVRRDGHRRGAAGRLQHEIRKRHRYVSVDFDPHRAFGVRAGNNVPAALERKDSRIEGVRPSVAGKIREIVPIDRDADVPLLRDDIRA